MAIRVYLANNHEMIKEGLKSILSKNPVFQIFDELINIDPVITVQSVKPNIIFLDIIKDNDCSLNFVKKIKSWNPKVLIVAITCFDDKSDYVELVNSEYINGMFSINACSEEISKGINYIIQNKKYIQESILDAIDKIDEGKINDVDKIKSLTKREMEILIQVSNGMFNKEIATLLNISERTVKNHISSLFKKIEVSDRTQAAVFAIKNKIVEI